MEESDFLSSLNDEIDNKIEEQKSRSKDNTFDDLVKTLSGVLIDPKFKRNLISNFSKRNAKGIIQYATKIQFLRSRFGKIRIPEYEFDEDTGKYIIDPITKKPKITGYKLRYYDTSVAETIINQALVNYPAVGGKQADKIVDMLKNNISGLTDMQKTESLISRFGMFKR